MTTERDELALGAFFADARGRELRTVINARAQRPVRRIADIGGGDGTVLFPMATDGAAVVCVDLDEERLAVGAREAHRRGLPMAYVVGDALKLPVASESCDVVVVYAALETMIDVAAALAESARVLRPGGFVIALTPNPHSPITLLDDPHAHLPFAHVLPHRIARAYAAALGRRMPSAGVAFRVPTWGQLTMGFAAAGLDLELESSLLLKLSNPDYVLSPLRRRVARIAERSGIVQSLRRGSLTPLRRTWDRRIGRSWLLLGRKPG